MSVTLKEVERIAQLAHLSFTEVEKVTLTHEMNAILTYMEKLNSLDSSDVAPLSHVIDLRNVFREDEVRECIEKNDALRNAPAKTADFFKVPKVIGDR